MRGLSLGSLQLHCWSTGGVITVDVTTHLGMGFLVVYSVELFQMRLLQISVFVCLFLELGFVGGRMCVRVILLCPLQQWSVGSSPVACTSLS